MQRSSEHRSSGYKSFRLFVPLRLAGVSPFRPPGTLGTCGTRSFQILGYPGDWWHSVLSGRRVTWGLAGLCPFRPQRALESGATQSFQASRHPTTGETQSFQVPRYPGDRRDSVLSGPQVLLGLAGLSPFRSPGTLGTGGTQSFQGPRYPADWRGSVISTPRYPGG